MLRLTSFAGVMACFVLCLPPAIGQVTYTESALALGVNHAYTLGNYHGGGVSVCDFDGDGWDDITLAMGTGSATQLFKNLGGTGFQQLVVPSLWDISQTNQVLWVDFDNDGDKDFFMANVGTNRLFRNNGNMQFVEVSAATGLPLTGEPSVAACWADYDRDGDLDLYYVNYAWGSILGRNRLFRNDGLAFTDVTDSSGASDSIRLSLAAAFLDYDNDGWPDIFVANDKTDRNSLYRNLGDGTFQDVSGSAGVDQVICAMSAGIGDFDGNGYSDIYITNTPSGNALLKNNGNGTMTEIGVDAGVAMYSSCWGANFLDYNNDGLLDIYVSSNSPGTYFNSGALFKNMGNDFFLEPSGIGMDGDTVASYSNAVADFNQDGYPDLVQSNVSPYNSHVWMNSGGSNNWLRIGLQGTVSNKDAIGSSLRVYCGNDVFYRYSHCGIGFIGQNSSVELVGLGANTFVDSIRVIWPNGLSELAVDLLANQQLHFVENTSLPPAQCPPLDVAFTSALDFESVVLQWTARPSAKGFHLRGRETGATGFVELYLVNNYTYSLPAGGLQSGTEYEWQVRALCDPADLSNAGDWSPMDTFWTSSCTAPDSLWVANISDQSAQLHWTFAEGADGYRLQGRELGSSSVVSIDIVGGPTLSFAATGLSPATTYEWAVATYCDGGAVLSLLSLPDQFSTTTSKRSPGMLTWIGIHPNPATDFFSIQTDTEDLLEVRVHDTGGRLLLHEADYRSGQSLRTGNWSAGMYLVEVLSAAGDRSLYKLLIQD